MPTETEIYILPDGQVVIADLPAELSDLVVRLGDVDACAAELDATADAPASVRHTRHEDK